MAGKKEVLANGMYECKYNGEDRIYHSSTAQTLLDKGLITVGKKIKEYKPKAAK